MKNHHRFGFNIFEILIYILCISFGLPFFIDNVRTNDDFKIPTGSLAMRFFITWHCVNAFVPMLFFSHVALVLIYIKKGNDRARLLDPGFSSGFVAIVVVLVKIAGIFALWGAFALHQAEGTMAAFIDKLTETEWTARLREAYFELQGEIGILVTSLWILLMLSKQWKPNPTGNGLLGRF